MAAALYPVPGVTERELAEAAVQASLGDDTPEGRSILSFVRDRHGFTTALPDTATVIPFTAQTRVSGLDHDGGAWRKGAVDNILKLTREPAPAAFTQAVERVARAGSTPLAVTRDNRLLGVIELKDIVKPGIRERFSELRRMGIRTVMVTGDCRGHAAGQTGLYP
jgi:K+-transporting ATPase ATPase B chain